MILHQFLFQFLLYLTSKNYHGVIFFNDLIFETCLENSIVIFKMPTLVPIAKYAHTFDIGNNLTQ